MKRILSLILTLVMVTACLAPAASAAKDISVKVNGKEVVWTDARPYIDQNNRTMVPLRAVADAMGLDVSWDSAKRIAAFSQSGVDASTKCPWSLSIEFPIGSRTATGIAAAYWPYSEPDFYYTSIKMDTAAVIKNSRTYAPIRYLAEYFDCTVKWDNATRTVLITGDLPAAKVNYVSPSSVSKNYLKGTWEVATWRWTQASREQMGMVQSSGYLVFQPRGKMAYQCWDVCYEGTYRINTKSTGNSYAVCTLENGWNLTLDLTIHDGEVGILTAKGMPKVTCGSADGVYYTTTDWELTYWSSSTTIGVDPWLQ